MSAVRNEKGQWVIPATRRPDGTWRKETIMKEGYVPQEERAAFETKASRSKEGKSKVPGLPPTVFKPPKEDKPKKKAEKMKSDTSVTEATKAISDVQIVSTTDVPIVVDKGKEKEKKLKNLRKKLKDINELKAKKESGIELSGEQIEKLNRKDEIEAEIARVSES